MAKKKNSTNFYVGLLALSAFVTYLTVILKIPGYNLPHFTGCVSGVIGFPFAIKTAFVIPDVVNCPAEFFTPNVAIYSLWLADIAFWFLVFWKISILLKKK